MPRDTALGQAALSPTWRGAGFLPRYLGGGILGIVLLAFLPALAGTDWGMVFGILSMIPLWAWALIILGQAAIVLAGSAKWRLLLARLPDNPQRIPFRAATRATTLGALLGQILPIQIVTPLTRAWVARHHDISTGRAVGASLMEQLFEVIALAAAATGSVTLFAFGEIGPASVGAAFGAAVLVLMGVTAGLNTLARFLGGLGLRSGLLGKLSQTAGIAASLPRGATFGLLLLSLFRYGLLVGLNVGIFALLLPGIDLTVLILAYPLIIAVLSFPVFPGGLGVVEATWVGVLATSGIDTATAVEAALALRIILVGGFLFGVPALLWPVMPRGRT